MGAASGLALGHSRRRSLVRSIARPLGKRPSKYAAGQAAGREGERRHKKKDAGEKTASSTSGCRRPSIVSALPSTVGRVQARCDAHSASANNASTSPTNRAAFRKGARKVPATFEHSRRISAAALVQAFDASRRSEARRATSFVVNSTSPPRRVASSVTCDAFRTAAAPAFVTLKT